jgi:hypothetical protein
MIPGPIKRAALRHVAVIFSSSEDFGKPRLRMSRFIKDADYRE